MTQATFSKVIDASPSTHRETERETESGSYYAIGKGTLIIETDTGTYTLEIETNIAKRGIYTVSDISGPKFDKASLQVLIPYLFENVDQMATSSGFLVGLVEHLPLEDMIELIDGTEEGWVVEYLPEMFPEKVK